MQQVEVIAQHNRTWDYPNDVNIRIDQVGYRTDGEKLFFRLADGYPGFSLLDWCDREVFSGTMKRSVNGDRYGFPVWQGDFSAVAEPGVYRIKTEGGLFSYPFSIDDNLYAPVLLAASRFFYLQRSSVPLLPKHAGLFARSAGHSDTACAMDPSAGDAGPVDVSGGWYDAGDYGKYIVNGGVAVHALLNLLEFRPGVVADGDLNIPESGNGRSDLLDEVLFELDWFEKMQSPDGGVWFKVAGYSWSPFVPPVKDEVPRVVFGKSTASALNFAATLAQAARVIAGTKGDDKALGEKGKRYLSKAVKAWDWACDHPSVPEPKNTGGSGRYGDKVWHDEFFWAACELALSTGEKRFVDKVCETWKTIPLRRIVKWSKVTLCGFYSLLAAESPWIDRQGLTDRLVKLNLPFAARMESDPIKIPMTDKDFIWGSNGEAANYGVLAAVLYRITGRDGFRQQGENILHYLLGRNGNGICHVSGFGSLWPKNFHHRIFASDSLPEPPAGILSGGPNKKMQDSMYNIPYPSKEPILCYADHVFSFASNEAAINWNAPLVQLLGLLSDLP
jgi:endoglucanase